jgi:thymidylate synthase ThyX
LISAKIIADSFNPTFDARITTFELVYPRFIHGELMTHRVFSRNAASSRAIPIDKVIELVEATPAMPVHWGANQAGMQAKEEVVGKELAKLLWLNARDSAVANARLLQKAGLHKQIVNRVLEPFQLIKTIVTATQWNNWFWLRDHVDAQPEIAELAAVMAIAYDASAPELLVNNEWHVPYVKTLVSPYQGRIYLDELDNYITVEEARMISASCCAQVSYRKNDGSLEKASMVFDRLINSVPVHASPVEHIATPIPYESFAGDYLDIEGVTHIDKNNVPHSGNFHGWIQFRQLIPNNVKAL